MTYQEKWTHAYARGAQAFFRYCELAELDPEASAIEISNADLVSAQSELFDAGCENIYDELLIKIAFDCGWADAEATE